MKRIVVKGATTVRIVCPVRLKSAGVKGGTRSGRSPDAPVQGLRGHTTAEAPAGGSWKQRHSSDAASTLGVGVEVGKKGAKGVPVDQTADLTQPITQICKAGIFVPNRKIGKRARGENVDRRL